MVGSRLRPSTSGHGPHIQSARYGGIRTSAQGRRQTLRIRGKLDSSWGLLTLAGLIVIALPALVGLDLNQKYGAAVTAAETTADNLARSLDEHAERTIESVDSYLRTMVVLLRDGPVSERASLIQRALSDRAEVSPDLTAIIVTDAQGKTTFSSAPIPANFAIEDREYFTVQRDRPGAGLYISRAIKGRGTGKWVIPLVRRFTNEDGAFAGIIMAALDLDAFRSYYAALEVGEGGSFTLFKGGTLLARQPFDPALLERDYSSGPIVQLADRQPIGRVWAAPATDGVPRIISYRKLQRYPLLVSAALSQDEVLAPWKRAAWLEATIALFTVALLVVTLTILARSSRERARAMTDREQQSKELQTAMQAAEAANLAKTDFLATMSHEIRTPLNGVLGYTGLLLDDRDLNAEARRSAERIKSAGQALLSVVNDILDFSVIEAGRIVLERQPFSLHQMVDNTMSIIQGGVRGESLKVDVELDPMVPGTLSGDPDRLRQILLNLLNNAVKFTQTGTVKLAVSSLSNDDGRCLLRFAVSDTGIGIPEDKRSRLFRRFSQVDSSIERRFGGTGLGLAISKQLVELMGGEIGVESTLGQGSTFWFTISFDVAEAPASSPAPERSGVHLRPAHILLVEDMEINQGIARAVLELVGHTVDVVDNGSDAISAVQSRRYDVVLMDVQMPGMDGITATRRIRALKEPANRVTIIAMTANVLPHQIAEFGEAGMNGHIGKPFKRDELYATIERCLPPSPTRTASATASDPFFDEAKFADLCAVMDADKLPDMLRRYATELTAKFRSDASGGDHTVAAREAHAVAPSAELLGFVGFAQDCREMEVIAPGPDSDLLLERCRTSRDRVVRRLSELDLATLGVESAARVGGTGR